MAVEVAEARCIVDNGSGIYGNRGSQQRGNLDEGLHQRVRDPVGGIPALLRQSKCHPTREERCIPLLNQAHPEEISLAPGEGRR